MKNFKDVNVILLDDGFQSLYIGRDIDVVLLNHKNKYILNREPFAGLKRADVVVFNDGTRKKLIVKFANLKKI